MFACWLYWSGTELHTASFLVENILISANEITEGSGKTEGGRIDLVQTTWKCDGNKCGQITFKKRLTSVLKITHP